MSAMPSPPPRPLRFTAFVTNAAGRAVQGTRRRILAREADFDEPENWVRLARTLERGRFDAVFFADAAGRHAPGHGDQHGFFEAGYLAPGGWAEEYAEVTGKL